MKYDVMAAALLRRSIYSLDKDIPVPESRVEEIVKEALLNAPSPFNCQSGRAAILFGNAHDGLWDEILEILKPKLKNTEALQKTSQKIGAFKAARGTILFFEDQAVIQSLQEQFPLYKEKFLLWSPQSSGMLQYLVWTTLASEEIGASLQHYNPLIDEWVSKKVGAAASWRLMAQMPFGRVAAPAEDKSFLPVAERMKVLR